MISLIIGIVTLLLFAFIAFVAVLVMVAIGGTIFRLTRSMVPASVRRRLMGDLNRSMENDQVESMKRKWMKADGWEVEE